MRDIKDKNNDIMSDQSLADRLKYAENMYERVSAQEDLDAWQKVIDLLKEAIRKKEELASISETGFVSEEQRNAALLASAQKLDQSRGELNAMRKEDAAHREEREYGKLTDFEQQIQNREAKLKELKKKERTLILQVFGSQGVENDKSLSPELRLNAQRETVELQKKEAEAAREVQKVREQIEDLRAKREKDASGMIDSAKFELEYQTLIAKCEYDKAEALKLEHDLKQKNLKLTDEEKKALSDTLKQRKELNFAQT